MSAQPKETSPEKTATEPQLAEQQVSTILTIAADAIISLNESLCITLFNDGACAIFGYSKEEILGQSLDVLIPPGI